MNLLHTLDHIPDGLLELPARRLHEQLDGPTLITVQGQKTEPVFISVLLHGNEDTGWDSLRQWLSDQQRLQYPLPRTLVIFLGNIEAAKNGLRRLDNQPDYNRIWKGGNSAEATMSKEIVETVAAMKPFAAIDLHNNTGTNPHYACINKLEPSFLHLALLFGRTIIYFTQPDSVLSRAFADICPAITVEAGKPGEQGGIEHCHNLIDAVMHLHHFPDHVPARHDYDLFHTVAVAKVAEGADFAVEPKKADLSFRVDLDKLNFSELRAGTPLASYAGSTLPLTVTEECGREVTEHYFSLKNGELCTAIPLMPSMLTLNTHIIRQDCLCYLMQRIHLEDNL